MAGVQRVAVYWLPDSVAAFQLSNGRIITVAAEDLDRLGRACLAASVDWRIRTQLDECERRVPHLPAAE